MAVQFADDGTVHVLSGDSVHGTEQQRVMAYQQVGAAFDGLVDHRHGGVRGECDQSDVGTGLADDQAGRVP